MLLRKKIWAGIVWVKSGAYESVIKLNTITLYHCINQNKKRKRLARES